MQRRLKDIFQKVFMPQENIRAWPVPEHGKYLRKSPERALQKFQKSAYGKNMGAKPDEVRCPIDLIYQYSPKIGRRMVDWMALNNIGVYTKNISAWGQCEWGPHHPRIYIAENSNPVFNVSVMAHEMMHAVQSGVWNRLGWGRDWQIEDIILHNRSYESAAQTFAIEVCFDMKQNGYAAAFDYQLYDVSTPYTILFDVYERTYHQNLSATGDATMARQTARDKTFHTYFAVQPVIDLYNDSVLQKCAEVFCAEPPSNRHPYRGFQPFQARALTEITKNEFFLSKAQLNAKSENLYGGNTLMRQAFEYLDYCRHKTIYGADHYPVRTKAAELCADENPYQSLNMKTVLDDYYDRLDDDKEARFLDEMCRAAGIGMQKQLSFTFFPPEPAIQINHNPSDILTRDDIRKRFLSPCM